MTALTLTATTGAATVLATSHLRHVLDKSPTATGFVFLLPFRPVVVAGSTAPPR